MNSFDVVFALPGLSAGMLLWQHAMLLLGATWAMTLSPTNSAGPDEGDGVKTAILVVTVFGVVWMGAFGGVVLYLIRASKFGWAWFFVGAAAVPCVTIPMAWRHLRPRKRIRGPSPWGDT